MTGMDDTEMQMARELAAAILERESPDALVWREGPDESDYWWVGTFVMNNDAKFDVRLKDGVFTVGRRWFRRWDEAEPRESAPLGTATDRAGVEELIRASIAQDGPHALHHPEAQRG